MRLLIDCPIKDEGFKDINPVVCGVEECEPAYSCGPFVRTHYLLHYVLSGKGVLYKDNKAYPVSEGQFFLILPDEITTYVADEKEPWTYVWVGFTGRLAKRFGTLTHPVGSLPKSIFLDLVKMIQEDFPNWQGMREEYLVCTVHKISARIFEPAEPAHHHAKKVKTFIETSYMKDITVQGIADAMFLDRRYLSRLFKECYGVGVQEFLIDVRLKNAASFLGDGFSVNESCEMCGFKDRSNFSKMFRRKYGVWPSKYGKPQLVYRVKEE